MALPLWASKMTHKNDTASTFENGVNCLQCASNTTIVRHLTVFIEWDVEVDPNQNTGTRRVKLSNRTVFRHGGPPRGSIAQDIRTCRLRLTVSAWRTPSLVLVWYI